MAAKSSMMLSFLVIVLVIFSCSEKVQGGYDMVRAKLNSVGCSSSGHCSHEKCLCPSCVCVNNACVCTPFPTSNTQTNI
ncbi:hypothetical protein M5689_017325 [Euphorbia peplus]|nr:hypothetical protein M5689_017325 [Euphorbia peplus]